MTVGGRFGPLAVIRGMAKMRIQRRLVEKEFDEAGVEFAELEVFPSDFERQVKVQSWNDRFFEVITVELELAPEDLFAMFDDEDHDDGDEV